MELGWYRLFGKALDWLALTYRLVKYCAGSTYTCRLVKRWASKQANSGSNLFLLTFVVRICVYE